MLTDAGCRPAGNHSGQDPSCGYTHRACRFPTITWDGVCLPTRTPATSSNQEALLPLQGNLTYTKAKYVMEWLLRNHLCLEIWSLYPH